MGKYSKAKGMAQWRTSLGKHETQKPRKRALSFTELQSYVESQGVATSQHRTNQAEGKLPQTAKYREAKHKKEETKARAQARRDYHQFNQSRLLTLVGILLMLAEKVEGNRQRHQNQNPASQSLIRQYWKDKPTTGPITPDVRAKPGDMFRAIDLFSQPFEAPPTLPQFHENNRLRFSGHIPGEGKANLPHSAHNFISSTVFQTPLHRACEENDIEIVRQLLSKGADFTLTNGDGKTAFDLACDQDAFPLVRLLLAYGYDAQTPVGIDMGSGIPVTNLFLAVQNDNYKLAYTLLRYGKILSSPLFVEMAEKNNNPKMKELLQIYLSKPPRKPSDLIGVSTVAEESTVQFQGKEIFNQVNQAIFDISNKVQTPGFYIQPRGRNAGTCIYETYLNEDLQPQSEHWTFSNSESYEFCLAILLESYEDMVRLFPSVDRNYRLPRGYNWMILSAVAHDVRFPNFFLHRGFDFNQTTVAGETALHTLASNSKSRSIPDYIAAGVDLNAQDNHGRTPLMVAISNWNLKQARELLAGGADPYIRDKKGRNVGVIASEQKCLKELNEILFTLGKIPFSVPSQEISAKTLREDDSWISQYGAVLIGALIPLITTFAYYVYRKQQQPLIVAAPIAKAKKKAVLAADNPKILSPRPALISTTEHDVETLRRKTQEYLETIRLCLGQKERAYQQQPSDILVKQTRALNTFYRLRKKAQALEMEARCEESFNRVNKDIILLGDFMGAIFEGILEQHQKSYERLMIDIQNPELKYESLELLCKQAKTLLEKIKEAEALFLEKQENAQKAIERIDRNLDSLEQQFIAIDEKNQQVLARQQEEEIKQKSEQEQRALDKKKWQEEKKQRKLSKMEEMKKSKKEEKKGEKRSSDKKRKGKEPAVKKTKKWEPYLETLRSDVDLLENILDADKINLYLVDPRILLQCQFYGSCYYVMRIFHRLSKMPKFGLGNYAPCSADEAMQIRNAIMHRYEAWFSNPEQMIAIAREVVRKLRHTCDALSRGEPAQQMDISIRLPENIGYSRIQVLDRLYEDYLKVSEEAVRLALEGKYDFSQPFHGILKAFNFMLGQVLKDFNIRDNPFAAHRDDIGHRFDTDAEAEDGEGLSEEVNRWVLFGLCKAPVLQQLAILVNECQHQAGMNLALGSESAASSSSQSSPNAGEFPRFFAHQPGSGSAIVGSSHATVRKQPGGRH